MGSWQQVFKNQNLHHVKAEFLSALTLHSRKKGKTKGEIGGKRISQILTGLRLPASHHLHS